MDGSGGHTSGAGAPKGRKVFRGFLLDPPSPMRPTSRPALATPHGGGTESPGAPQDRPVLPAHRSRGLAPPRPRPPGRARGRRAGRRVSRRRLGGSRGGAPPWSWRTASTRDAIVLPRDRTNGRERSGGARGRAGRPAARRRPACGRSSPRRWARSTPPCPRRAAPPSGGLTGSPRGRRYGRSPSGSERPRLPAPRLARPQDAARLCSGPGVTIGVGRQPSRAGVARKTFTATRCGRLHDGTRVAGAAGRRAPREVEPAVSTKGHHAPRAGHPSPAQQARRGAAALPRPT